MLEKIKTNIGITGNYQDETIKGYIEEVKQFLIDAGVPKNVVEADTSVGIISCGVSDLWNYGSGNASLSPYFMQRAIQLASKKKNKQTDRCNNLSLFVGNGGF